MPNVQRMDGSCGVSSEGRWLPPPTLPMCEPAQVLVSGADRRDEDGGLATRTEARTQWPFLYSYRGDTVIVNKGVRKTTYQQATEVGEALL